jgi:hypothetical protein
MSISGFASTVTAILIATSSSIALAQSYESINWTPISDPAGFNYSVPSTWSLEDDPSFTAIVVADDQSAYCTLKRTKDYAFDLITAEMYVADRIASPGVMEEQLLLQYPDGTGALISIKEFPFGFESGVLITSSGNMFGESVVSSVFQTVQLGSAFTLGCFALPERHGYYFPIFAKIVGSFNFPG